MIHPRANNSCQIQIIKKTAYMHFLAEYFIAFFRAFSSREEFLLKTGLKLEVG